MTTKHEVRYCGNCANALEWLEQEEDGGAKARMRCAACGYTHWNNTIPVLAAIVECVDRDGLVLLARNAAWKGRMFALITGFMEAGESPEEGIAREVAEETALVVERSSLVGVYEFTRMNQVIIAYHVQARGEIRLSPELAEYKLMRPEDIKCWPAGTGKAVADWLRSKGIEPQWMEFPRPEATQEASS